MTYDPNYPVYPSYQPETNYPPITYIPPAPQTHVLEWEDFREPAAIYYYCTCGYWMGTVPHLKLREVFEMFYTDHLPGPYIKRQPGRVAR